MDFLFISPYGNFPSKREFVIEEFYHVNRVGTVDTSCRCGSVYRLLRGVVLRDAQTYEEYKRDLILCKFLEMTLP